MSFSQAISSVFRQYARFSGRAGRSEYWWFFLFSILLYVAVLLVDRYGALAGLVLLALLLPTIAVGVRRLHDTGHSGWWLLISFVPLVGGIVLLVFLVSAGNPEVNKYGPLSAASAPAGAAA